MVLRDSLKKVRADYGPRIEALEKAVFADKPEPPRPEPPKPEPQPGRTQVPVPDSIVSDARAGRHTDKALNDFTVGLRAGVTVLFPEAVDFGIDDSVFVDDKEDLEFVFNGSRIVAATPGHRVRSNIRVRGGSVIRFLGPTVVGTRHRPALEYPRHDPIPGTNDAADYQHGVSLESSSGVTLLSPVILNVQTDPICTGPDRRGDNYFKPYGAIPPCENTVIEDIVARNAGRTIGFTHTKGLRMERGLIEGMFDNSVDIEVDDDEGGGQWAYDVALRDLQLGERNFAALALGGPHMPARSGKIRMERCRDRDGASVTNRMGRSCFGVVYGDVTGTGHSLGDGVEIVDNGPFYIEGTAIRLDRVASGAVLRNKIVWTEGAACGPQDTVQLSACGEFTVEGNDGPGAAPGSLMVRRSG